jgi:hypothetical protein
LFAAVHESPNLARDGHRIGCRRCPFFGVERKSLGFAPKSEGDCDKADIGMELAGFR